MPRSGSAPFVRACGFRHSGGGFANWKLWYPAHNLPQNRCGCYGECADILLFVGGFLSVPRRLFRGHGTVQGDGGFQDIHENLDCHECDQYCGECSAALHI